LVLLAVSLGAACVAHAQATDPAAVQEVRKAVAAELDASKTDKSIWMYQERDTTSEKNALYETVETSHGTLKRLIELNGKMLSGRAEQTELQRINNYVHDTAAQAKAHRSAAHDDAQTTEMLKMLPEAFIWTRGAQTADSETLKYRPNPDFHPPNMQARVMSIMAGEMIIVLPGHRIRTLRGALTDDVRFGFGILGKLDRGGTFDVERRMVGDGRWQIAETRVHIGGRALLFKNIGQQEDDIKTNWHPSPAHTLEEAAQILTATRSDHP
jgi:hypothetical protein